MTFYAVCLARILFMLRASLNSRTQMNTASLLLGSTSFGFGSYAGNDLANSVNAANIEKTTRPRGRGTEKDMHTSALCSSKEGPRLIQICRRRFCTALEPSPLAESMVELSILLLVATLTKCCELASAH
jgi:hypothetical protein